jgi:hypothetical protein
MAKIDVCEIRGPLIDLIDKLSGEEGSEWLSSLKLMLKKVSLSVLRLITTVSVLGAKKFVAADAFGPNNPDGIKFFLGENFKKNFLGKIEKNVEPAEIAVHRLEEGRRNPEIMAELGPEKRVISLAHFYNLIKAQAQGQEGPLLVNDYANIACIEDDQGTIWAVGGDWRSCGHGWGVGACSAGGPIEWVAGCQVLSQV